MDIQAINKQLGHTSWDYALPQDWVDEVISVTGKNPFGHIVWSYKDAGVFGKPVAITPLGATILKEFDPC